MPTGERRLPLLRHVLCSASPSRRLRAVGPPAAPLKGWGGAGKGRGERDPRVEAVPWRGGIDDGMRVHAVLRLVAGHPRCRCSLRTHCGERFSGCGLAPTAWQGHTAASVGCASLSLHRSLLHAGTGCWGGCRRSTRPRVRPVLRRDRPNVDQSIEAVGYPVGVAACAWGSGRQSASAARLFIHDSARPPTLRVGAGSRGTTPSGWC